MLLSDMHGCKVDVNAWNTQYYVDVQSFIIIATNCMSNSWDGGGMGDGGVGGDVKLDPKRP